MPNYYHKTIGRRSKRRVLVLIMVCAAMLLSLTSLFEDPSKDAGEQSAPPLMRDAGREEAESVAGLSETGRTADNSEPLGTECESSPVELKSGVVRKGDTIMALLGDFFSPAEIIGLARDCEDIFSLSRISAGHAYAISTTGDDFHGFEYEINDAEKLRILRAEEGFQVERAPIEYDVRVERVAGSISSNLFEAVEQAGETAELAVRLADIFAWDIDFIRDIRQGDSFTVLVEKRFRDDEPAGYGRILVAEFTNQGEAHRGYLFEADEGQAHYYDEDGRSLRKAFLKAPLDFRRISSGFSLRRLHPVLGVYRPHPGIDYAAPVGTPVKSVGDGVVTRVARDNAAGRYVSIRHNSTYETSYLHLSRFANGLKRGLRVRQGQVIGYVGQTGYATGPHLDFRMKKNGRYINPNKLKAPPAEGVPQAHMEAFAQVVSRMRAELERDGRYSAEAERVDRPAL